MLVHVTYADATPCPIPHAPSQREFIAYFGLAANAPSSEDEDDEDEGDEYAPSSTAGGSSDPAESAFGRRVSQRQASASGLRAMLAPRRSVRAGRAACCLVLRCMRSCVQHMTQQYTSRTWVLFSVHHCPRECVVVCARTRTAHASQPHLQAHDARHQPRTQHQGLPRGSRPPPATSAASPQPSPAVPPLPWALRWGPPSVAQTACSTPPTSA